MKALLSGIALTISLVSTSLFAGKTNELSFGGIGISLQTKADGYYVKNVLVDGPAAEAGLEAQQKIVAVEGVAVDRQVPLKELVQMLRGKAGAEVAITTEFDGEIQDWVLTRTQMDVVVGRIKGQQEVFSAQQLSDSLQIQRRDWQVFADGKSLQKAKYAKGVRSRKGVSHIWAVRFADSENEGQKGETATKLIKNAPELKINGQKASARKAKVQNGMLIIH